MATTRYNLMKKSTTVKDQDGNFYFDPLTLRLDKFRLTRSALQYFLEDTNIKRMDLLMYESYTTPYLGDILLLLNNIGILDDTENGTEFYLPEKVDIDNFIVSNRPIS